MSEAMTEVEVSRPLPAGAIVVTLFACAAFLALDALPLPGINAGRINPGAFHLASLGLQAIVEAFILVEVVAVLVPGLRPLRRTAEGRIRLRQVTYLLVAALALIKVYGVVRYAESAQLFEAHSVLQRPALDPRVALGGAVMLGMFAPVVLAAVIDARGIGVGYSVLIATGLGSGAVLAAYRLISEPEGDPLLALVLLAGAFPFAAFRMLRVDPDREYRLPTSGIEPVHQAVIVALLALNTSFAQAFFWPWVQSIDRQWVVRALQLLLTVALCRLFSKLFHKPVTEESAADLRRAVRASVLWLCGLTIAAWYVDHVFAKVSSGAIDSLSLIAFVAVAMDLAHELRAHLRNGKQRVLRVLDRLEDADSLSGALQAAGISPALRGAHHRALFHFFAPFIPISVLVGETDHEHGEVIALEHERTRTEPLPLPM